jgi:hypothetical protein
MRVKYVLAQSPHDFEIADSDDLSALCSATEERLRRDHPELGGQGFLTERVADALLNSLAADGEEADLGDLSPAS